MAKKKEKAETNEEESAQDGDEEAPKFRILWRAYALITAFIMFLLFGMVGFMVLEPDMDPLKAFHLVIQTITTTGYGDIPLQTQEGRVLSDIMMIFGVTIAAFGAASLMEFIISGKLRETMRTMDYAAMVSKLRDHVVVVGYGRVGQAAVHELMKEKVPLVLLEKDPAALTNLDKSIPRIVGDGTNDENLRKCGIKKAVAVIVTGGSDADNLMTLVSVKYLKPGIIGISRASVEEDTDKFLKVGADMVISPESEGGKSMAGMLKDNKDLVIVAGYGRVGSAAVKELMSMGIPVMVMEKDPVVLMSIPDNIKHTGGDATKESDLRKAGIDKASAIIPAYSVDANNLLATVTVKYFRPSITVISRASSQGNVKKILKVGADVVISPEVEGGKSMAKWAGQAHQMVHQKE